MFCCYCGTQLPDDSQFCTQCGQPTNAASTATVREENTRIPPAEEGRGELPAVPTEEPSKTIPASPVEERRQKPPVVQRLLSFARAHKAVTVVACVVLAVTVALLIIHKVSPGFILHQIVAPIFGRLPISIIRQMPEVIRHPLLGY